MRAKVRPDPPFALKGPPLTGRRPPDIKGTMKYRIWLVLALLLGLGAGSAPALAETAAPGTGAPALVEEPDLVMHSYC